MSRIFIIGVCLSLLSATSLCAANPGDIDFRLSLVKDVTSYHLGEPILDTVLQTVEWLHQPLGFDSLALLLGHSTYSKKLDRVYGCIIIKVFEGQRLVPKLQAPADDRGFFYERTFRLSPVFKSRIEPALAAREQLTQTGAHLYPTWFFYV